MSSSSPLPPPVLPPSSLSRVAKMAQLAMDDPSLELEVRLGKWSGRSFSPGVSREHMHSLLLLLDASPHVDRMDAEWEETEDYFYEDESSSSAPPRRRLRTRVESHSASLLRATETVHKTRLEELVLCSHIVDMRVSLCREEVVDAASLPPVVQPDLVRLKHVRRFRPATASPATSRSPYVVTCALAWQGKDASDAEVRQRTVDPRYEIECELDCHGGTVPPRMRKDASTVAASLLQKATDLMLPLHSVVFHSPSSQGGGSGGVPPLATSSSSLTPPPRLLAPRSPPSLPSPPASDERGGGRPKRPRAGGGESG